MGLQETKLTDEHFPAAAPCGRQATPPSTRGRRPTDEQVFLWWDYRMINFRRNRGLRIDLILASPALAQQCTAARVDVEPRRWRRPSDHAPVVAEFAP
ncbi:endonuclease/exonuclease/phosphatase family protein [Aquisalimonas sp.]|uniref:endonuclease/exonuclease/phosphatase family protein n=1 Tax=Aquisalimonas sp. TaxID=1872621 RepID=UPI00345423A6